MLNYLAAGAGGFIGAVLRYGICSAAAKFGASFWGTFSVNATGCFLIGVLAAFEFKNLQSLRVFLIAGVLGGFTTFSAFSLDALILFKDGEILKAFLYIFSTLIVCLLSVSAGCFAVKLFN